jgi:hypothetical protein
MTKADAEHKGSHSRRIASAIRTRRDLRRFKIRAGLRHLDEVRQIKRRARRHIGRRNSTATNGNDEKSRTKHEHYLTRCEARDRVRESAQSLTRLPA